MVRRFLLRSLALAAILLACIAHLVWNGWNAQRTVAENLPHPKLSSGKREIDLWHPTVSPGHVYDFTWEWPEERPWSVPEGTRLEVQLASSGRTRLLVVQPGHPNVAPSWWDVLRGRVRLQVVGDREWIDLGPIPTEGTKVERQVYGLLPGPFSFAEPWKPSSVHFSAFRIGRPDSPRARPSRAIVRYRFRVADPLPAGETLARFFFFISCSRVLQVTGVAAIGLLFAGWFWLWEKRMARAVACLVPAVTLLHACGLPPLQGEDEATHAGTVEAVVCAPDFAAFPSNYPASMAALYHRIGYEDWVGEPGRPVTALLPAERPALREFLGQSLRLESTKAIYQLADAYVIDPQWRAPFYYNAFRVLAPALRRMSILDRTSAYVVLSSLASLVFFVCGLALFKRFLIPAGITGAYGLVALWPYAVGVVASCSNYSPAIGIGQLLAACLVTVILAEAPAARLWCAALFSIVSVVAIGVWDDFVFLAIPAVCVATASAVVAAWRSHEGKRRTLIVAATAAVGILAALTLVYSVATGRIRQFVSSLGARLPKEIGGFGDPSLWLLLAVAAAPLVVSLVLALSVLRAKDWAAHTRARAAWIRSAALTILFVALFTTTRWTSIPFETTRFDFPDEVAAHWSAFWSNSFAFDQDTLSWKMYFGVFGYPDVEYPDVVYALARWIFVGLILALPVLGWRFTQRDPGHSVLLLGATGLALAACIVTNSIRYFQPNNPWGRYVLPLLPLVALPLFTRLLDSRVPARARQGVVAALVTLHLWTAVVLFGTRYGIGS